MRRLSLLIVNLFLLSSCDTSGQLTTPTVPNRSSSLAQINLETLVLQPGDLPSMEATFEKSVPSPFSADSRLGVATAFARLLKQDDYVLGGIYVDVYTDTADTKKAYDDEAQELQASLQDGYTLITPSVGDQALLQYRGKDDRVSIVIHRCHAYIWISLPVARETILAYAKRLDTRLSSLVCP